MTLDLRAQLRTDIRQQRRLLSVSTQEQAMLTVHKRLITHPKIQQAQHIAIYLANDGELDLTQFIQWCWQQDKKLYLPVIHPFSKGQLLFLHYDNNTIMINNRYGIKEPKLDVRDIYPIKQLDVLLTPLVAFDESCARLGMGGGFYDRSLHSWYQRFQHNKYAKPYPIGLAHDCQKIEKVPNASWDIPLPEIITPSKAFTVI